jgi:hypothetical protein
MARRRRAVGLKGAHIQPEFMEKALLTTFPKVAHTRRLHRKRLAQATLRPGAAVHAVSGAQSGVP